MTEFHSRDPLGDREFGSFHESQPEPTFHPEDSSASDPTPGRREDPPRDDARPGAAGGPGDSGDPVGESNEGERRRRRRGGRRRRSAGRANESLSPPRPGFDAELAVEPPLPEAEFPPFESGDARTAPREPMGDRGDPSAILDPARKRRRRGRRRGRGRGPDAAANENSPDGGAWPADASLVPSSDQAPGAESNSPEHPIDPLISPPAESGRGPRRRGRGRRGSQRGDRGDLAGNSPSELGERQAPDASGEDPSQIQPARSRQRQDLAGNSAAVPGKRRRRGSRGGRGRARGLEPVRDPASPLGVELIPFEDDDLPAAFLSPPPPPAPVRQPAKRKRHGPRSRDDHDGVREPARDSGRELERASLEHEPAKPQLRRKNVILVNASDREEIRVAVVEAHQIVDFQMTVRKHKLLVNDIYRGRVVNLEPAIGAAFVDFGQGRNGFLHTSDVLSVYGEKDFTLQKLLTAKIDPDEWDRDDAQTDSVPEPGDAQVPIALQSASAPASIESSETAPAAENSEDFAEIVDDHHEMHAAEAARAERALEESREAHDHDEQHEDLFSFDRDESHHDHDEASDADQTAELPDLPEATMEIGFATEETDAQESQGVTAAPAEISDGENRAQRGRRTLRKTRGAARATQGGARGRAGQQFGNGSRRQARPRRPITELLEKGQVVVVQITKDAIGEKGPTLTTYISIPGRHLVLMPSMARTGVSRKIEDEKERRRLKKILTSLDHLPPGMGVIVRTAGVGCSREDLQRDLDYLLALWTDFEQRLNLGRGPAPLYEESDVAIRTVRDLFNSSTEAVIVDDPEVFQRVREFTAKLMTPEDLERIQLHDGAKPLFHSYGVEQDFERIFSRRIELPSGGSIVFDQTEALVAIDVNSGKTRSEGFDFEEIALKTNLEAAPEIARQIRLRDLGGIIVCDFIDMQRAGSRRAVERAFSQALSADRARSKLGRISQFGLLELTRQRLGPGLSKMLFHNCVRCRGSGRTRTVESRSGSILRRLGAALPQKGFGRVEVRAAADAVEYLKANCVQELKDLEGRHQKGITLVAVSDQLEDSVLRYLRPDGREVRPGGRRKR